MKPVFLSQFEINNNIIRQDLQDKVITSMFTIAIQWTKYIRVYNQKLSTSPLNDDVVAKAVVFNFFESHEHLDKITNKLNQQFGTEDKPYLSYSVTSLYFRPTTSHNQLLKYIKSKLIGTDSTRNNWTKYLTDKRYRPRFEHRFIQDDSQIELTPTWATDSYVRYKTVNEQKTRIHRRKLEGIVDEVEKRNWKIIQKVQEFLSLHIAPLLTSPYQYLMEKKNQVLSSAVLSSKCRSDLNHNLAYDVKERLKTASKPATQGVLEKLRLEFKNLINNKGQKSTSREKGKEKGNTKRSKKRKIQKPKQKNSSGEAKPTSHGKNTTGQNKYPKQNGNTNPTKPSASAKEKKGTGTKNTYVKVKKVRFSHKHQFTRQTEKGKKKTDRK